MALTRSMLKGMGLTDEQVSAIIDAHTETVDGLKAERDQYKADAKALPGVKKELEDLKSGDADWKDKYEKEHKAFEDFKKDTTARENTEKVKTAYQKLLKANNVGEKHIDSILRVTDFGTMKLGDDGKLADESKLVESIKADWAGFIETQTEKGANVSNPPSGGNGNHVTREEIYKKDDRGRYVHDTQTRQQMLVESMKTAE